MTEDRPLFKPLNIWEGLCQTGPEDNAMRAFC